MRGTAFALGVLCVGCGPEFTVHERLVPDGATGMISLDLPKLADPTLRRFIGTNDDADDASAVWTMRDRCGPQTETLRAVVFAFDEGTDSQMIVAEGPGLGDEEFVSCAMAAWDEDDPVAFSDDDGLRVFSGDERRGWILDDDTVVVCSKAWSSLVEARLRHRGKAAVEHNLLAATKAVDTRAGAWGVMTTASSSGLFGLGFTLAWTGLTGLGDSPEFVTGSMSIRGGETHVAMGLQMADDESARKFAAQGLKKLAASKARLASSGTPVEFLDSLEIGTASALVRIEGHAPTEALFAPTDE